jgi:hypothetical protein
MPDDDLFGPHNPAWERFKTPTPKRKSSRFVPAPVQVLSVPEDMAEKIRAQRAKEAYEVGLETLQQWKGRLPAAEWEKLRTKVEGLRVKA